MKYRLVSLGHLKKGVSEKEAIEALMAATKLPEAGVRKRLLSGKRVNLVTSANVGKVAATKSKFQKIGLMVEVVEIEEEIPLDKKAQKKKDKEDKKIRRAKNRKDRKKKAANGLAQIKRFFVGLMAIAFLLVAAAGGLFYWVFYSHSDVNQLESALINSNTAAVLNIDMAQVAKIETLTRIHASDLLADAESQPLLTDVIALTELESFSLDQAYLSVLANNQESLDVLAVVTGQFSVDKWNAALARYYELQNTADGLIEMKPKVEVPEAQCPADVDADAAPVYAKLTGQMFVMSSDAQAILRFQSRLGGLAETSEELTRWQQYKKTKLTTGMVFSLKNSSAALPGFVGMMSSGLVKAVPNVEGAAISAKADVLTQSVHLNAAVFSKDTQWNSTTAQQANNWLAQTRLDTNVTSKAFSSVLAQLTFTGGAQSVDVDWPIHYQMIADLQHSLQNQIASMLGGGFSSSDDEPVQINNQPTIYNLPLDLAALPDFEVNEFGGQPLFKEGAFVADVKNVRMANAGVLELSVEAKAALPKLEQSDSLSDQLRYSLSIHSVLNGEGNNLIRDESCVSLATISGVRNEDAETQGMAFFEQASATKLTRLVEGTNVSDIQKVSGEYQLSFPKLVQKLPLTLAAGERVEFAGVSLEIIRLTPRSVRYKLVGNEDNVLEVRALNDAGEVLRQSWSSSIGKMKDQNYQGEIASLEVYIADGYNQISMPFSMENIFVRPSDEDDAVHPFSLSHTAVQRAKWNKYQFVDMRLVKGQPEQWSYGEAPRKAVAEKAWPGVKLHVSHAPSSWNNNPDGHLTLPLWVELYASMSSLSYTLEQNGERRTTYIPVQFPYRSHEQGIDLVESQIVREQKFGLINFGFDADYQEGQSFGDLKGHITLSLPQILREDDLLFNQLWQETDNHGALVTLNSVNRGNFSGYEFFVKGDITNVIAVYGVTDYGERVAPSAINYQSSGYWTVVVPFREELNTLRVVTATEQDVFEMPFNF